MTFNRSGPSKHATGKFSVTSNPNLYPAALRNSERFSTVSLSTAVRLRF